MIGEKYGHFLDGTFARLISKTRLTPNQLTIIGFLTTAAAAYLIAFNLLAGGILIIIGGLFDILDGMVARVKGKSTRFGAYLDSVLDRVSDGLLFFGVAYFLRGDFIAVLLCMANLLGSFLVSYTRARAEGLGVDCKVGIMERPERVILLALGAITGLILPALWIMFFLTFITVFQRIFYTKKALS